jgi:hypothetical protein
MSDILKEVKVKHVRKDHECNACLWLDGIGSTPESIFDQLTLTDEEKESIVKAHKNKWKVKKGDPAIYRVGLTDGDFGAWYSIPEIDDICIKYDLYDC